MMGFGQNLSQFSRSCAPQRNEVFGAGIVLLQVSIGGGLYDSKGLEGKEDGLRRSLQCLDPNKTCNGYFAPTEHRGWHLHHSVFPTAE